MGQNTFRNSNNKIKNIVVYNDTEYNIPITVIIRNIVTMYGCRKLFLNVGNNTKHSIATVINTNA